MDLLATRLAAGLDTRYGHRAEQVTDHGDHARLTVDGAALTARAVVLAVPAPVALRLTDGADPDATGYPAASTYRPMYKVSCALDRPLAPRGGAYALLTPACGEPVLSCVVADHLKCPDRAPAGRGLISLLVSPRRIPELVDAGRRKPPARSPPRRNATYPASVPPSPPPTSTTGRGPCPNSPPGLALRGAFLRRPARAVEYAGDWVAARPSSEGAARSGALAAARVLAHLAPRRGATVPQETAA